MADKTPTPTPNPLDVPYRLARLETHVSELIGQMRQLVHKTDIYMTNLGIDTQPLREINIMIDKALLEPASRTETVGNSRRSSDSDLVVARLCADDQKTAKA